VKSDFFEKSKVKLSGIFEEKLFFRILHENLNYFSFSNFFRALSYNMNHQDPMLDQLCSK